MRSLAGLVGFLLLAGFFAVTNAAPPQNKPASNLSKVDADLLRPGTFSGVLVSVPNSERMFTLRVTYPEVRLKPGAKMPNLRSMEARTMHQMMQQMHRAQQMPAMRGGYHRANAFSNMMQMQQRYMQGQQRMAQAMARAEQQELQLLRQEIRAIQNMYQIVPVTREVEFQAEENVKVRVKDAPETFDEKGRIKKYTKAELSELKGKDKNLMGYESSSEALKPGQTVLVSLRTHKKPKPPTPIDRAVNKDKEIENEATDSPLEHKMQVTAIVILKDGNAPPTPPPPNKNKK